jgi:hypothetical protein
VATRPGAYEGARAAGLGRIPCVGWLWLASGVPVGLMLLAAPLPLLVGFFTFAVCLEVGHALSPIVFAWSHAGYRRLIFKYPARYLLVPGGFLAAAFAVGAATSLGWTSYVKPPHDLTGQSYAFTDFRNPFGIMVSCYWLWNIYHFGMQNFGVLSMCRTGRSAAPRQTMVRIAERDVLWPRPAAVACLAVTAFGMVALPKSIESTELRMVFYAMIFVNHWAVAIGLPGSVEASLEESWPRARAWAFVLGVLLLGGSGFVWSAPAWVWRARGFSLPAHVSEYMLIAHVVPVVLSLRYGLSFVHFLYDRHIWKMSDPEIRAILAPAFGGRVVAAPVAVKLGRVPRPVATR